ncbi:MAG: diacylglycerol kinase family lipid kinase [Oscillospiraceae bacterium]|nr:diacylglycerol kinase family lipid kinase [Oscillospiraceae bacterium]
MNSKRLLLIYNPNSGMKTIAKKLSDIVDVFTKGGYSVTVHPTQRWLDCLETVSENCKGDYDRIVIAGGDGTLNEAVNGFMAADFWGSFGYIPCGSTNDFSKSVGIPTRTLDAAKTALDGVPFVCDLGKLNDRYFTYVAAFGTLAEVSYSTPQNAKNQLGFSAYILEGLASIPSMTSYKLSFESEERSGKGDYILGLILNTVHVGGMKIRGVENIRLDDGQFEVLLIRNPKNTTELNHIISSVMKLDFDNEYMDGFKTSKITLRCQTPIAWTVDGEKGGEFKETTVEVREKSLRVLVKEKDKRKQ